MRIIFATGNAGKMREIREIMADMDMEICSMKEAGISLDIEENGTTFEENAQIKAKAVAACTKDIVLADDSGLEVDYLNKEPGVYSARYLGEDASYDIKNQAISEGMNTLKMAATNAVKEGVTTIAEMVKATYEAEEDDSQPNAKNANAGAVKKPAAPASSLTSGLSAGRSDDNEIVEIELEQID